MRSNGWLYLVIVLPVFSKGDASGLYKIGDNVTIFNADNILPTIKTSACMWLVEYYLEWCGHCQSYAPLYKEFANDVLSWYPVVKIAAINCADDTNNKFCSKQNITGVPDLRFYLPGSDLEHENGINIAGERNTKSLREALLSLVEKNIDQVRWLFDWPKPNLSPATYDVIVKQALTARDTNHVYFVIIFENTNSTLGKEIILDLSACKRVVVRRVVVESFDGKTLKRKLNLPNEVPIAVVAFRNGTIITVNPSIKSREIFSKKLKVLPDFIETKDDIFYNLRNKLHQGPVNLIDYRTVKRDHVYLADIESGLHYMLTMEISANKIISNEKLEALKQLLKLFVEVGHNFPGRRSTTAFFKDLYSWVKTKNLIVVSEWLKKIKSNNNHSFLPSTSKKWVGCLSSVANMRGYPCSLWTIFHALTVAVYNSKTDRKIFPSVMHDYITNFFGCLECRKNFKKEIADLPYVSTANPYDVIIWLWKMHNKVNKRLHSQSSEDPAFPKIQFPSSSLCPQCWDAESSNWKEDDVARFLINHFSPDSVSWDYIDLQSSSLSKNGNRGDTILSNKKLAQLHPSQHFAILSLTSLDWSICMLMGFISIAGVVTLLIAYSKIGFFRKSKATKHLL